MQALPHLSHEGMTLVLYGDVPLTSVETLKKLISTAADETFALLTVELADPSGYGRIVRSDTGAVVAIVEEKDASGSQRKIQEINTGIMVIPNRYLHGWLHQAGKQQCPKGILPNRYGRDGSKGWLKVETGQPVHDWETTGINSKAQLAELERIYQGEYAGKLLEQGVTLADPSRIDIRGQLTCGRDVEIDIDCIFEGDVQLGDGVKVGAHSILKNVKIAAGSAIAPFSLIEAAEIGKNCRIGPYARIRPGTRLANEVHIGNFVEVKNSAIARRQQGKPPQLHRGCRDRQERQYRRRNDYLQL